MHYMLKMQLEAIGRERFERLCERHGVDSKAVTALIARAWDRAHVGEKISTTDVRGVLDAALARRQDAKESR